MSKTIEALYYGRISPWDKKLPDCPETRKARVDCQSAENAFVSQLTPALHEEYDQTITAAATLSSLETAQSFSDGFQLGVRLVVEALYE